VYQLMKFASRNRWLVVSSGAAVAAVAAGLVLSSVLYLREQQSSQEARRQANLSTAVREYLLRDLLTAAAPRRMGYEVRMLDVLKGAANGLEEKFKDYPEVEAEVRMDLTVAFDDLGKPAESMEHARRARELFEQTRGEDASRTIEVITRMAQISRGQHDAAAAVAFASEALKRAKRSLPENDPVRGRAHSQLGASLMMAGRRAEALVELKLALPVFERCGAPCETDALSVLTWLQAALAEARDDRAALEYSRQILIRTDKLSGPENPEAIAARSNLVNALVNSGEFNEAAEIAEKLPALAMRTFPPGHPARAYSHLAALSAMMKAGRREEAERVGLKAHELSIESLGEFSWVTERTIQLMRNLYMGWPEHEQQLWEWQLLAIRLRLTVAKPDEHVASMKLFRDVVAEQRRQGVEMPIEIVMRQMWDRRDEVAPRGKGHRAVLLANASRVAAELGGKNIAAAALKLAKESLADATDAAGAAAAIAAAEGGAAPVK
jgi:tetratricopeptide (TPR) repeat protein